MARSRRSTWRTEAARWHRLFGSTVCVAVLYWLSTTGFAEARAAPFEGAGAGELVSGSVAARALASATARKAALEEAIASASSVVTVQAGQLDKVRLDWASWTGAYRVAAVDLTATQVLARIEVDVDVPRLKKVLAATATTETGDKFSWEGVSMSGCRAVATPTEIHSLLADAGLVREPTGADRSVEGGAGQTLHVTLSCSDTGAVAFTYLRGAKARIVAKIGDAPMPEIVGVGLGATPTEAIKMAVKEGVDGLALALARRGSGGVRLVLKGAWRAVDAESLVRRIRDTVRGADDVRVLEIGAGGEFVLAVATSATAERTYRAISELEYIRVNGLELRMNVHGGIDVLASTTTP